MDKSSIGDRFKGYEKQSSRELLRRTPVIVRVDGKAFHTYTQGMEVFDQGMEACRSSVMSFLSRNIQNAVFAYCQSDEISILLKDWTTLTTQPYFGNKQSKIESVIASMATAVWNRHANIYLPEKQHNQFALFDARAFNVPMEEVCNYFVWRQQDATRNSIQMLGRKHFSHKQLHKKNTNQIQEMLLTKKDINWNDIEIWKRRGSCYINGQYDSEPPIFTKDRDYINQLLKPEEE